MSMTLRAATASDDSQIRRLFAQSFPASPKTSAEITRWQYWENPFAEVRSWVWEDDGEIVAHYAGMPVPIVADHRDAVGAVGIDAATAPSHRGRGLFESLASAVYRDCGNHGMPVTLCFPNQYSLRGFVKAGGIVVGELATYVFPVDSAWIARRFRVPTPVAKAATRLAFRTHKPGGAGECPGVPEDVDDLWQSTRATVAWGIRRDASWWRWRYGQKPDAQYRFFAYRFDGRLLGMAVTSTREDFGGKFAMLLEFLAPDVEAARAVLAAVIRDSPGVHGVATVALPLSALADTAKTAGMRRLPARLAPKPLHFGVSDNVGGRGDFVRSRWSLAWGDLDHV